MNKDRTNVMMSRRQFGKTALVASSAVVAAATPLRYALGDTPLKIGLILPYSGVYANFGEGITAGINFALKKHGNQLGGRPVEVIKGDGKLNPKIGGELALKQVTSDKVDMVVGTAGSNVLPVVAKVCIDNNTFLIDPTAASNSLTREHCNPLIFRISHSNWQLTHPAGSWIYNKGKRRAMTMGMNYVTGREEVDAFAEAFKKAGGEVIDQKWPGLHELDYQAYFADVLAKKPDMMFTFFAGSNAVEFVKQYAQAGLKDKVPLYGSEYLTDSTLLDAEGKAADGVITSAQWAPTLDNPANKKFTSEFKNATGKEADLNSMEGHDTIEVIALGLEKTKGDTKDRKALSKALQSVEFESPRGPFRFSSARNPIQNIYAVEAKDGKLHVLEVMQKDVEDPTVACHA